MPCMSFASSLGPCSSGCPMSPTMLATVGIWKFSMDSLEGFTRVEFGSLARRKLMMKFEIMMELNLVMMKRSL